ncbi:hypothetical protein FPE01S_05_01290 [Flavihumibacter petaseus NBRC 106054]|uniref:Porin n=2 Tax=Flavihumibacter TaxID=1004301 RepID=A0A0E9N6J3_9BACT|nr:hypothetical protein FPE01S_05_01290 [Flavihumibacter petaseus NBRC 106054]
MTIAVQLNYSCSFGQDSTKIRSLPDGTEGERLEVIDSSTIHKKPWNMLDGKFSTLKFGVAFLFEYAGFSPDETVKEQMKQAKVELNSGFDVRDFRFLLSGQIKSKREITWKAGLMYDGSLKSWFVRESGIMIAFPEIRSHVFVGRTKEGFSLSKVMSGYAVEMMERHMASDPIPILADGIKWMGFLPKSGFFWNLGIFADWLSKGQSFSTDRWQLASRIGWMPVHSPKTNLHLAANIRFGHPLNDTIRLKSRPESNPAPFFIDTGKFPAEQSTYFGGEAYYSSGPLQIGTEIFWHKFNSPTTNDPLFHGGEIMVSYFFTGESRPYSTDAGNIYGYVPVKKSVFKGGKGVWEAVIRYSSFDLDAGTIKGGRFWKITPMVNWYLADFLRFELAYGYGVLNRFNMQGGTHFLQSRLQFLIR